MFYFSVFLVLFFFVSVCTSGRLYITEPNLGNTWNPGSNVAIKWVPIGDNYNPNCQISIDLMDGEAQNANIVAHVGDGIPGSATQYNWIVPANIDKRQDYFIRIASQDQNGVNYFYSGRYAVSGDVMAATPVRQEWEHSGKRHKKTSDAVASAVTSATPLPTPTTDISPTSTATPTTSSVKPSESSTATSTSTTSSTTSSSSTSTKASPTTTNNKNEDLGDDKSTAANLPIYDLFLGVSAIISLVVIPLAVGIAI